MPATLDDVADWMEAATQDDINKLLNKFDWTLKSELAECIPLSCYDADRIAEAYEAAINAGHIVPREDVVDPYFIRRAVEALAEGNCKAAMENLERALPDHFNWGTETALAQIRLDFGAGFPKEAP